jgi:HAE1 family hydrophobic/amphiphilic exporter-1
MNVPEFCVRRPAFTTMLVMSLVVTGIFSFRDLGVDLLPKAEPATVSISVRLPGASAEELVTSVTEPLEQALSGIAGVDEIQARLNSGSARLSVRFVLERDIEEAAQDVREKVAAAMRNLPPQVQPPVVTKSDPDAFPILTLAVGGSFGLRTLTEVADRQIRRALEAVNGVGEVTVAGGRAREMQITIDIEKLSALGLTIDQVRDAIVAENVEMPGGRIDQGDAEVVLRTLGRLETVDQFREIVVATVEGTPVRVADIAEVVDGEEDEAQTAAFLDGQRAVLMDVRRQSGQNTVQVIEDVKAALAGLQRTLPQGVNVVITRDDSRFIYASIRSLEEHLLLGSLFACLVVLLFIRNVPVMIVSALAIPASLVAAFTLMRAMDFTLNGMTLLALTLAVGIVIDDAIVVLENIFRHIDEEGRPPFHAAIEGTNEVMLAVAATSLSLIVIFLPVAFMTGYSQRFIYPFGLTMAFAIMVSFVISVTLTPMLSARVLTRTGGHQARRQRFYERIDAFYTRSLRWSLAHRGAIVAISVATFASTFFLAPIVGRSFLPTEDQGEFDITLDAPEGTSLAGMEKIVLDASEKLKRVEGVAHVIPKISERPNHAHLGVDLVPLEERSLSQEEVGALARGVMVDYAAYRPTVIFRTATGGGEAGGWPILVNLYGPDLDTLSAYSVQLSDRLASLPGFIDVKARVNLGNPELRVEVDRQRAADLGVRLHDLGEALRLMVSGEDEITSFRDGGERYPVKMQVRRDQRDDVEAIGALMVPSRHGEPVRIDNVAQLVRGVGPTSVQRIDREFAVGVSSDLLPDVPLDAATPIVEAEIRRLSLPPGYRARFAGQSRLLEETAANMLLAIGLASIFIYMVLAAQFESFVQPLVIMTALPLSIPFALLTLAVTGRALNLWSALGILLLLGIVKKNSILQVDYTNVLRRRGVPLGEALVDASRTRLRPILMTTAAIIAGLIPTALGVGVGARQRADIAMTIVGGQTLCLFLTLLLVPVSYSLAEEARERLAASRLRAQLGRWAGILVRKPAAQD